MTPLVDQAAVADAMRLFLLPGQVTEVRALEAAMAGDSRRHKVISGYFDDVASLVAAVAKLRLARGVYFVLNPINPALLGRAVNKLLPAYGTPTTSDQDIIRRHWLLIDCDAKRPAGIAATDDEHQAAIDQARRIRDELSGAGRPEMLVLADSGNGGHLLCRIDRPADDGGFVQRCLAGLAARYDTAAVKVDQSVYNPARICKLYGTLACKGDADAVRYGRPHRMSRILEVT